ncbi:MAG: hypothetical protein DCF25_15925 [Leptolyngbya foveolarum]|uniref:Excalibur calcium-binding domain-containing protein n=1 Tax=Leptolyngbya foveolarum TaxID=47253 RepID=A0A2W4TXF4_9CYAN|nr:MAG: hypothetical protein DCF25_15925 [Leptolyngbya foveolarum]
MPKLGSKKWHQQKRWIFGSLLLFPPLGIPLLWLSPLSKAGKISGSVLSGILLLSVLTGEASEPTTATAPSPTIEAPEAPARVDPALSPAYEEAIAEATAATAELTTAESPADWTDIADGWQRAISSLGDIPINSNDYSQAQAKIAEYERNYEYAILSRRGYANAQKTTIETAAAAAIVQQQVEEEQQAVSQEAETVMPIVEAQGGGYVSGTCKDLAASGVGSDFRPGDANYTSARDRDGDGVACES